MTKVPVYEINGFKVFEQSDMTITAPYVVDLSLWDRLTSWPWRPWKKSYTVHITIADPKVYMTTIDGQRAIVGHPDTIQEVSRKIVEKIETQKEIL